MRVEKIIVVVRAVIKYGDKYLVVKQKNASKNTYILFPGGHVNPDENLKEAIIREVNEELNIDDIEPVKVVFIKETHSPFDRNYEVFFKCITLTSFDKISVKQTGLIGFEEIKSCHLKTKGELRSSKNFFPKNFWSKIKYDYLELNLDEYIKKFGKDRNTERQ